MWPLPGTALERLPKVMLRADVSLPSPSPKNRAVANCSEKKGSPKSDIILCYAILWDCSILYIHIVILIFISDVFLLL